LALVDADVHSVVLGQVMAEQLSVPEILVITELTRKSAQILANGMVEGFIQRSWPPRTRHLLKTRKTALFKMPHPVLNGAGTA